MATVNVIHDAVYLVGGRRSEGEKLPSNAAIREWLTANGFDQVRIYARANAGDAFAPPAIYVEVEGASVAKALPFAVPAVAGAANWDTMVQMRRAGPTGDVEIPEGADLDAIWVIPFAPQPPTAPLPVPFAPGAPPSGALVPAPAAGPLELNLTGKVLAAAGVVGLGVGAYHGWKRNESLGWSLVWAAAGLVAPIITIPLAVAQGFGEPHSAGDDGED